MSSGIINDFECKKYGLGTTEESDYGTMSSSEDEKQDFTCESPDLLDEKQDFTCESPEFFDEKQDFTCTSPELLEAADNVRVELLPQQSRELYWSTYNAFIEWKDANRVKTISESVMLTYFGVLANKYKPSTLWTKYSMLRSTIKIKHNIKVKKFTRLLAFLKQKSNGYEAKKSKALTLDNVKKFLSDAPDKTYMVTKVALIFGLFGACRNGELCSLTTNDVIDHGKIIEVTLKHTKNKNTRSFCIEGEPLGLIKTYRSLRPENATVDRFFLTYRNGKCTNQPLGKNKFGSMPKEIAKFLQLADPEQYTGHAFRRSSATLCADRGFTITDFTSLGGWTSSTIAESYIKDSINHKKKRSREITDVIEGTSREDVTSQPEPKKTKLQSRGHQRSPSDTRDFKERTKRDALIQLQHEVDRLLATAPPSEQDRLSREFKGFTRLFDRFLQEEGPSLEWNRIQKLPEAAVRDYTTLPTPAEEVIKSMLEKLVVVKLNGGLGTSMGCHGPKSVIAVRNDLTFLDLTVQQIEDLNKTYNANVPLILMNSFNTDEDTQKIIRKYKGLNVDIYTFNQSCYPRINRDSLLPIGKNCNIDQDIESWYPPGHGDFYESFQNSGLLNKFIQQGRKYCFISNIDNLGATVDLNILNLLLNSKDVISPEFVMEVTNKTRADVKGGTLIQYEDKLRLLEIAQVPKEHVDDFKSVKTFKFFNTNNLWVSLTAIERVLEEKTLNMEIIVNNKSLSNGLNVIQLETAVGAAMKSFDGGLGINVPRSRFLPVKKTSDLMLVMSNLYSLRKGALLMSPQRMFPTTPLIKLGDNHFSKVKEYLRRFASIPDLLELDHLTVSGDVTFGKGVSLKGTVIIIANHGDRIDIPSGTILENKIVSGNLRILDH
ncbi:UTP--glucose-1-phosphate uridylyltransferase isoform X1 [Neodiprion virginianus]|uniref:UTP--glucose-1-phosphate uridylyltransferase isoform X1 n=1 Tax=Neodiprion virginianus TaxID=2961670 RepID=UPI001EE746D9|nr:UTP--glucose-1-phosphate uridylyltransferase isoform X1 [Neodiprion virginianus]